MSFFCFFLLIQGHGSLSNTEMYVKLLSLEWVWCFVVMLTVTFRYEDKTETQKHPETLNQLWSDFTASKGAASTLRELLQVAYLVGGEDTWA